MAVTTPKAEIVDKAYTLQTPVSPRPMRLLAFCYEYCNFRSRLLHQS